MDFAELINALRNMVNYALGYAGNLMGSFTEEQWFFLIVGLTLLVISIVNAIRAKTFGGYKLWAIMFKVSIFLIVLAFAWQNIIWVYEQTMQLTGNPVAAFLMIALAGILGINVVKTLLERAKK